MNIIKLYILTPMFVFSSVIHNANAQFDFGCNRSSPVEKARCVEEQKRRDGDFTNGSRTLKTIVDQLLISVMGMTQSQETAVSRYIKLIEQKEGLSLVVKNPKIQFTPAQLVNKLYILDMLNRIVEHPNENTQDQKRYFFWDYDQNQRIFTITTLEPFYLDFGLVPFSEVPSKYIYNIKFKIFKEIAHTWGFGDPQAETFAKKILDVFQIYDLSSAGCDASYEAAYNEIKSANVSEVEIKKKVYEYIIKTLSEAKNGTGILLDSLLNKNANLSITCRMAVKSKNIQLDMEQLSQAVLRANSNGIFCPNGILIDNVDDFNKLIILTAAQIKAKEC